MKPNSPCPTPRRASSARVRIRADVARRGSHVHQHRVHVVRPRMSACTAAPKVSNSLMRGFLLVTVQHVAGHRDIEGRARLRADQQAVLVRGEFAGGREARPHPRTSMNCWRHHVRDGEVDLRLRSSSVIVDAVHPDVELPVLHRGSWHPTMRCPTRPRSSGGGKISSTGAVFPTHGLAGQRVDEIEGRVCVLRDCLYRAPAEIGRRSVRGVLAKSLTWPLSRGGRLGGLLSAEWPQWVQQPRWAHRCGALGAGAHEVRAIDERDQDQGRKNNGLPHVLLRASEWASMTPGIGRAYRSILMRRRGVTSTRGRKPYPDEIIDYLYIYYTGAKMVRGQRIPTEEVNQ